MDDTRIKHLINFAILSTTLEIYFRTGGLDMLETDRLILDTRTLVGLELTNRIGLSGPFDAESAHAQCQLLNQFISRGRELETAFIVVDPSRLASPGSVNFHTAALRCLLAEKRAEGMKVDDRRRLYEARLANITRVLLDHYAHRVRPD